MASVTGERVKWHFLIWNYFLPSQWKIFEIYYQGIIPKASESNSKIFTVICLPVESYNWYVYGVRILAILYCYNLPKTSNIEINDIISNLKQTSFLEAIDIKARVVKSLMTYCYQSKIINVELKSIDFQEELKVGNISKKGSKSVPSNCRLSNNSIC